MTRAIGVDVSSVQSKIDYVKLATAVDFLIPKFSEGRWYDPCGLKHLEGARKAGLIVPVVDHVLSVRSTAADQAKVAIAAAKDHGVHVVLDWEIGPANVDAATEFAASITAEGLRCVWYSYPYFVQTATKLAPAKVSELVSHCEWWGATYHDERVAPTETAAPWIPQDYVGDWTFWQWSGNNGTSSPGISSVVDHDVFYGDRDELLAWAEI